MGIEDLMVYVLVLVRVGTIFAFLPFFGEGSTPRLLKAMAALVVSLALLPTVHTSLRITTWQPLEFVLFCTAEATYGLLMGTCALLVFKAMRTGGELIAQQMGMALAQVADPLSGGQGTLVGTLCETMGTIVFLAVGGHIWLFTAMQASFENWPLGGWLSAEFIKTVTVASVLQSFSMAIQLASPVLLLTFLISVTMALTARLVPQINVLIVGFPLRVGVGLIGLTVFLPLIVSYSSGVARAMITFMNGVAVGS